MNTAPSARYCAKSQPTARVWAIATSSTQRRYTRFETWPSSSMSDASGMIEIANRSGMRAMYMTPETASSRAGPAQPRQHVERRRPIRGARRAGLTGRLRSIVGLERVRQARAERLQDRQVVRAADLD